MWSALTETRLERSCPPSTGPFSVAVLRILPEMQWRLCPTLRKQETHGMKPDLPGRPQGTE